MVLLYAVGASFGLWAIAGHLAGSGEAPLSVADAARSATIYVQFRNPHHLLFIAFDPAWKWPLALIGTMAFLAAILLRSGANPHHRLLAGYALCTAPFFLFGILLGALGANSLLRYYWFRVPDTLLPFASIVLAAAFIQQWMQRREWLATAAWQRTARIAPLVLAGVLLAVCSVFAVQRATLSRPTFEASMPEGLADALVFAREHTPRDAVFLVEPSLDSFYLVAERAMFVAWRHMPATPPLILEWHQRLIACGGGIEPESSGWSALTEIRKRMHELSAAQVQQLVADWKLTHLLVDNRYNPFGDFADDDLPAGITRVFGGATHSIYAFDPVP